MRSSQFGFFKAEPIHQPFTNLGEVEVINGVLTNSGKQIFEKLLHPDYAGKYFPPGKHIFSIPHDSGIPHNYAFESRYGLTVRMDKYSQLVSDVVEMTQDGLGQGGASTVYSTVGKVCYRFDKAYELMFEPDLDKGVMKLTECKADPLMFEVNATVEYVRTRNIPHVRARHPLFGHSMDDVKWSIYPQRKHHGVSLMKLIKDDITSPTINLDDRFQLTILIFKKLKEQVFDHGVIHRDIKPENIMCTKTKHGWDINIIDYQFVKRAKDIDENRSGTAHYAAPERFASMSTESSDIYSAALTTAVLWLDNCQFRMLDEIDSEEVETERKKIDWNIDIDLPQQQLEIDEDSAQQLTAFLKKCLATDDSLRPDIDSCINEIENIYLQYKMRSAIPAAFHDSARVGLSAGQLARETISKAQTFIMPSEGSQIDMLERQITSVIKELTKIIKSVPDDEYALSTFLSAVNIDCCVGIHSQSALIDKLNDISSQFSDAFDSIFDIYRDMEAELKRRNDLEDQSEIPNLINIQLRQLNDFCGSILRTQVSLDPLFDATNHMRRKSGKTKLALSYFQSQPIDTAPHASKYSTP